MKFNQLCEWYLLQLILEANVGYVNNYIMDSSSSFFVSGLTVFCYMNFVEAIFSDWIKENEIWFTIKAIENCDYKWKRMVMLISQTSPSANLFTCKLFMTLTRICYMNIVE